MDAKGIYAGTVEVKGRPSASSIVPTSFKLDAADALYLLDVAGRRVLVLDANGTVTRQLELPKTGEFTDVAVDLAGTNSPSTASTRRLVGGEERHRLRRHRQEHEGQDELPRLDGVEQGEALPRRSSTGMESNLGIDGSYQGRQLAIGWNDGCVYYPSQLCITEGGAAFLADRNNNRVQYFSLAK